MVALILTFGPLSGAHFNPVVTIADASQGGLPWHEVPGYVVAKVVGAFVGVGVAHLCCTKQRSAHAERACKRAGRVTYRSIPQLAFKSDVQPRDCRYGLDEIQVNFDLGCMF